MYLHYCRLKGLHESLICIPCRHVLQQIMCEGQGKRYNGRWERVGTASVFGSRTWEQALGLHLNCHQTASCKLLSSFASLPVNWEDVLILHFLRCKMKSSGNVEGKN